MGFFDKIKQATNFITGGGATVEVQQIEPQSVQEGFLRLQVFCYIKDADININNVYIIVKSEERVSVEDFDYEASDGSARRETIYREHETFRHKAIIAEGQTLAANQNYDWVAEIPLPPNMHGTYKGVMAGHIWEVFAGLDKSGNDPDSGWQEIEVYF